MTQIFNASPKYELFLAPYMAYFQPHLITQLNDVMDIHGCISKLFSSLTTHMIALPHFGAWGQGREVYVLFGHVCEWAKYLRISANDHGYFLPYLRKVSNASTYKLLDGCNVSRCGGLKVCNDLMYFKSCSGYKGFTVLGYKSSLGNLDLVDIVRTPLNKCIFQHSLT